MRLAAKLLLLIVIAVVGLITFLFGPSALGVGLLVVAIIALVAILTGVLQVDVHIER